MDGRQKPDQQPENENDLNDKQAIDLTQIVEGGDDGEIVDLTDILEGPDQAWDEVVETEETVIPLGDAFPTDTSADMPDDTDDEEVIDLMDVATTLESELVEGEPEDPAAMSEGSVEITEDEEDVIDLMDVAATPETDADDADLPDPAAMPDETAETMQGDEPVIDLLDAMETPTAEAGTTVETDDDLTELESRAEAVLIDATNADYFETSEESAETVGPDSDFMVFEEDEVILCEDDTPAMDGHEPEASLDISEPAPAALFVPMSPSAPILLTEAQVEAALERTIEKIYGEKIEQLMIRAIEKTVTREIARIKNALLEDDDDMVG